ncbi:MAG: hypothetical protein EA391_12785 [Balneolaceae bacterium]|nr:MAG: hypothetical protein EA391_12785 [Balneolaceae bacterium]
MKKGILGGLIGVSIVLSIDSLSRVFIALSLDTSILMFSYSEYDGFIWPILLTVIAMLSAFAGAVFSFTYGKSHKYSSILSYLLSLILLRYGQIHLLYETETIVYPIIALILSLIAVLLAWKLIFPKPKAPESKDETEEKYHTAN